MLRTRLVASVVVVVAILGIVALSRGNHSPGAVASSTAPAATAPSSSLASGSSTTVPASAPSSTATTTTATPPSTTSAGPVPIELPGLPALEWKARPSADGHTGLWTLSTHPLRSSPSVTLAAALIDPSLFTAALFNGTGTPGGRGWHNGDRVPAAAVPALRIAFNGGFLFKHITGGYVTEGRTAKPLANGHATLAISADGRLSVGVLGRDVANDGTWLSLRQNLPPIVENGASSIGRYPGTYWGDNFHHVETDYRSAICTRDDGRLMYVAMGMVRIGTLAETLPKFGCRLGMELDINGHWPQFVWFTGGGQHPVGHLLDQRMWKPNRVLTGSEKDFVALFDPASLPSGVLWSRS